MKTHYVAKLSSLLVLCVITLAACSPQKTAPAAENAATGASAPASGAEATANNVVDLLSKGDFTGVTALFDATMQAALPASKLQQTWAGIAQQVGAFKGKSAARAATEQGYSVFYIPCQFERANLTAKVVLNASGQVAGLFFQ